MDLRHLNRVYYFDFRVKIVSFLLLSWGGNSLDEPGTMKALDPDARRDLVPAVQALHRKGIVHTDIRRANLVWSGELGRLLFIDFERALLLPLRRRALAPVLPNQRARISAAGNCKAGQQQDLEAKRRRRDDLAAARSIFNSELW